MNSYYKNRIKSLMGSKLSGQRLDISIAFKNRHNGLINNQGIMIVESKIREYKTWLYMNEILNKELNK